MGGAAVPAGSATEPHLPDSASHRAYNRLQFPTESSHPSLQVFRHVPEQNRTGTPQVPSHVPCTTLAIRCNDPTVMPHLAQVPLQPFVAVIGHGIMYLTTTYNFLCRYCCIHPSSALARCRTTTLTPTRAVIGTPGFTCASTRTLTATRAIIGTRTAACSFATTRAVIGTRGIARIPASPTCTGARAGAACASISASCIASSCASLGAVVGRTCAKEDVSRFVERDSGFELLDVEVENPMFFQGAGRTSRCFVRNACRRCGNGPDSLDVYYNLVVVFFQHSPAFGGLHGIQSRISVDIHTIVVFPSR